jgi:hypothetical protein
MFGGGPSREQPEREAKGHAKEKIRKTLQE